MNGPTSHHNIEEFAAEGETQARGASVGLCSFPRGCCNFATSRCRKRACLAAVVLRNGGFVMRMIAILAVLSVAFMPLGGCFFHHNQAVVTQPLPPLK